MSMSTELVPVGGLPDALRSMFAYADLQRIGDQVERRQQLDDYAEQQMAQTILACDAMIASDPYVTQLVGVRERAAHFSVPPRDETTTAHVTLGQIVRDVTRPTQINPGLSHTETIRQLAPTLHPDMGNSGNAEEVFKKITNARASNDDPLIQISAAAHYALTTGRESDIATLELRRYQATVGLAAGRRTKYADVKEVDSAVDERMTGVADQLPFAVLDLAMGATLDLIGFDPETNQASHLYGEGGLKLATSLQAYGALLNGKTPKDFGGIMADNRFMMELDEFILVLGDLCAIRESNREGTYDWQEGTRYLGVVIALLTKRLEALHKDEIFLKDFVLSSLRSALRPHS